MNKQTLSAYKAELSLIENQILELSNIPSIILERCGDVYRIYYSHLLIQTLDKDLYEKFINLSDKFNSLKRSSNVKISELEDRKQELNALITYENLNTVYEQLNTIIL